MGFELALAYGLILRESEIIDELVRLLQQHDKVVNELVVVTVNAAYRSGFWFPTAQVVADLLFKSKAPLASWSPVHLRRVLLYDKTRNRKRWLVGSGLRTTIA